MSALRLTLRQLQTFNAVAEHGSTAAAAEAIALSQSAASASLNELERMLGLALFDRVGKRLVLNDNGRTLVPQARALLDGAAGIERWARDGETQLGDMRIGASTTIGNYLLPGILADFRRSLPPAVGARWHVQVSIANAAAIEAQVSDFEVDFGLIEGPCHNPELTVLPWLEDELVVVAAPDDPILPKRRGHKITLARLRQATWLLREPGSGTREIINQLLIPHLHHLQSGIEFSNAEAIKRAAASGLGITCLSHSVVRDLTKVGALVAPATELPRLTRRFFLIVHPSKHRTRGLERLIGYLERLARPGNAPAARRIRSG